MKLSKGMFVGGAMVFVLLLGGYVEANSGHYGGRGASVFPLQSSDIQMVRERVELDSSGFTFHWGPESWQVRCTFLFENTAAKSVDVPMGFPVQSGMLPPSKTDKDKPRKGGALSDLKLWVDGKPMKTAISPDGTGKYREGLHTWTVSFESKQKREVVVTYQLSGSKTNDGFQYLRYIFTTGATWKGVIEKAELIVRFKDRARMPLKENNLNLPCKEGTEEPCLLAAPSLTGGDAPDNPSVWTWTFTDFKPEHDFYLVFSTAGYERYFRRQELVASEWEEAKQLSRDQQRELMWALSGKDVKGTSIESFVKNQDWYVVDPQFDTETSSQRLEPDQRVFLLAK